MMCSEVQNLLNITESDEIIKFIFILSPNKPLFLLVCNKSLLKTLWEKQKLLIMSHFYFSQPDIESYHLLQIKLSNTLNMTAANNTKIEKCLKIDLKNNVEIFYLLHMKDSCDIFQDPLKRLGNTPEGLQLCVQKWETF